MNDQDMANIREQTWQKGGGCYSSSVQVSTHFWSCGVNAKFLNMPEKKFHKYSAAFLFFSFFPQSLKNPAQADAVF